MQRSQDLMPYFVIFVGKFFWQKDMLSFCAARKNTNCGLCCKLTVNKSITLFLFRGESSDPGQETKASHCFCTLKQKHNVVFVQGFEQ